MKIKNKMNDPLESKIRQEQVVMNDAWLRADKIYKAELNRLREELNTKNMVIDQLTKGLRSLVYADGNTSVHLRFND